jgi:hypothetical protein
MGRTKTWLSLFSVVLMICLGPASARAEGHAPGLNAGVSATDPSGLSAALAQEIDLGGSRSTEAQYYDLVTTWVSFGPDGKRGESDTYLLKLMRHPLEGASTAGERYTCKRFVYIKPDGERVSIPALEGWTYAYKEGEDERGVVFGIDHARFQGMTDSNGNTLKQDKMYLIYNTFIDFHGLVDVFAKPIRDGRGIQDLTRIGQKIVHSAAHSTPPTNLGDSFKEGSYFTNGEITLALKGLSLVDDSACAVVGFDSGNSSFKMLMEPAPGVEVRSVGSSHYFGDIYVDLLSKWPRKIEMGELVIAQTRVPMPNNTPPMTIDSVMERQTVVKSVSREVFESD